jgi:glycine cleavage system H protein
MNIPEKRFYTKEHEWALVEDEIATVGITDYAQGELGDIVFIEMPQVGTQTKQMEPCASIEAVKAVSDLYAPVTGEIVEVNGELDSNPQTINQDAYGKGWILKIKMSDKNELDKLMSAEAYKKFIA